MNVQQNKSEFKHQTWMLLRDRFGFSGSFRSDPPYIYPLTPVLWPGRILVEQNLFHTARLSFDPLPRCLFRY